VTTDNLSLASYADLKVDFWFKPVSMENGEDFWLQISTDGGSSYSTVKSWTIRNGSTYENNNFYQESVELLGYGITDQTRVRFRCDASGNGDDVYIDEIIISAKGTASSAQRATTSKSEFIQDSPEETLLQNSVSKIYPNPVRSEMFVEYELTHDSHVSISIYNISGELVAHLIDNPQKAGKHTIEWNTSASRTYLDEGMYLVRLNLGSTIIVKQILILN